MLSQKNTETAIDVWIEKFDPVAVHCARTAARSRCIEFGAQEDPAGTVAVWGRLLATDAAVLRARLTALAATVQEDPAGTVAVWGRLLATDAAVLRARLTALAATVCEADPRTVGQRRADAMGLLAVDPNAERLTCLCGEPGCPAAGVDPRSAAVTVYVLTDTVPGAAADTPRDPGVHGDGLQALRGPAAVTGTPGVIPGGGVVPAPLVAELVATGARVTTLADTNDLTAEPRGGVVPAPLVAELVATGARVTTLADTNDLTAEPRYRPSAKLAAWVRTRDLTCTFPGCHRGAQYCDLDHSVPWPGGATHPGNLAALCRTHHLLKTFVLRPRPQRAVAGWGHPPRKSRRAVPYPSPTQNLRRLERRPASRRDTHLDQPQRAYLHHGAADPDPVPRQIHSHPGATTDTSRHRQRQRRWGSGAGHAPPPPHPRLHPRCPDQRRTPPQPTHPRTARETTAVLRELSIPAAQSNRRW
ncbi:HNH endonuclease signature motif containing protein [Mycolicibacterium fluoranthenivorans]|uniref:HNH endonuclease signature motif containing protein n=1 Tax=Mycolicibacterium fluoranthenivorans TaxID=258505 RepID=UPI0021F38537|nr:HNH endonuclease signature motif containing protein [Mycolicibacterium fluoranthenivorans]MCV7358001.1 DUF222 domain-containing protein [Mycolicibacterium fluoranthenivorans]